MPIGDVDKRNSWLIWKALRPVLSVGLGIFIVAQAIFLPLANGLGFLPQLRSFLKETTWARKWAPDWIDKKGEVYEVGKKADQLSQRWQELTGQPQRWSTPRRSTVAPPA